MTDFRRFNINGKASINSDIVVIDRNNAVLVFVSAVGYVTNIKETVKAINYNNNCYIQSYGTYKTAISGYDVETRKTSDSDFSHFVAYVKDKAFIDNNQQERISCYVFARNEEEIYDMIYDKLYKHMSVPLLREWIPNLYDSFRRLGFLKEMTVIHIYDAVPFQCFHLNISKQNLIDLITTALQENRISINNCQTVSNTMQNIEGIDSYLNTFGDILAERIQQSFTPKFIPGEQEYDETVNDFDDSCYEAGIELFEAQKAVIQSCVNNFKKSNIDFIIGEMGSGKTAIGAGVTYAHGKQLGNTTVVMCPSHLVNKWKREVEKLIPNAKGYIVRNLSDLLEIDHLVKDKTKKENSYIILSKESAKFGYESCPSAMWSRSKRAFVCPECGQVLTKKSYVGTGRYKREVFTPFNETDMSKEYAYNQTCSNTVTVWNKKTKSLENQTCNTKLWKPLNKEDIEFSDWIKLGKEGWILKSHIHPLYDSLITKTDLTKKDTALLLRLEDKVKEFNNTQQFTSLKRAPRKFPLAQYIKRYWKGKIDYFICDEVHLMKGESEQGYAFGDLVQSAKRTLCLTGTLLNGYADGLFYILYRTIPHIMYEDGFKYNDCQEFLRTYGVIKKTSRFTLENGSARDRIGQGSEKKLPGVSPLVFTKFLLDNAVFLSLSDMSEGLPEYTEIPIGVDMDNELARHYDSLESELRSNIGGPQGRGMKIMGQMVQSLSVYPDMPYNQPPIVHPDTNRIIVEPTSLEEGLRNKETRLLEIVQEKIELGEKVLIYYQWTNRTDTAKKLKKALDDLNINAAILESKVDADEREEWFEKQSEAGVQVVLCNPTLVETGLDLMEFTTIIFYQVGYNIFTMRQASRRSWRLGQDHAIEVYFMYYRNTIQEQALSLMATKLQASMAIEGKFSEEGLRAMSNNEDLLTQIANSVVNGIKETINADSFQTIRLAQNTDHHTVTRRRKTRAELEYRKPKISRLSCYNPKLETKSNINQLFKSIINHKIRVVDLY